MKKTLSEERREIRDEIEHMKARLAKMGEAVPEDMRLRIAELLAKSKAADEKHENAKKRVERLRRASRRGRPVYEAMVVEMPKWRTTILLGLNSAAIAALLGSDGIPASTIQSGSMLFLLGALAAFVSGSALSRLGERGLELHDELELADLEKDPEPDDEWDRALKASHEATRHFQFAELARWFSFAFFAVGVVTAVFRFAFF